MAPPWKSLAALAHPRPGNVVLALGAPGVGKSTFAVEWALDLAARGFPVLYLSFDTPLRDHAARIASKLTDDPVSKVLDAPNSYEDVLSQAGLAVRFSDVNLNVEDIPDLVAAETMWFGQTPSLIVLDNAGDMVKVDEASEYTRLFKTLRDQALRLETVFLALHHINRGPAADGKICPRMSEGNFAGERTARLVFGLWRPSADILNVAVLKNTMGAASPSGKVYVRLRCDMERATIFEEDEE